MRPTIRFEVFKRDAFVCQYCGKRPPNVVLEVDHVLPLAEGGDEDLDNLVTSCWECNRGKGRRLLDSRAPTRNLLEQAEAIREREKQLREYHAAKALEASRQEEQFTRVWNYWFEIWGEKEMARRYTPGRPSLQRYIDQLGPDEVMAAMDIAYERFSNLSTYPLRYMYGVLKRKVGRLEGRIVPCSICGKDCILGDGQDSSLSWRHTACAREEEAVG